MTEDQFLEIVHQHEAQIYQRIFYFLGSRKDAKDVTQSTARQKIGEVLCNAYSNVSSI